MKVFVFSTRKTPVRIIKADTPQDLVFAYNTMFEEFDFYGTFVYSQTPGLYQKALDGDVRARMLLLQEYQNEEYCRWELYDVEEKPDVS